jgi:hypothetical protein
MKHYELCPEFHVYRYMRAVKRGIHVMFREWHAAGKSQWIALVLPEACCWCEPSCSLLDAERRGLE